MFSALRQLKSAHLLLIAAKMAGTETLLAGWRLRLSGLHCMANYFFA
ncbi:hypothetical protein L2X78_18980 [Enterobacter mori]|jgi:hypothetical protein|nr:hypothetical protein [Enterobacter mori]